MRTSHGEATHGDPKVMSGKAIDCRYRDGFKKQELRGEFAAFVQINMDLN